MIEKLHKLNNIFPNAPLTAYRREENIKDVVVKSSLNAQGSPTESWLDDKLEEVDSEDDIPLTLLVEVINRDIQISNHFGDEC